MNRNKGWSHIPWTELKKTLAEGKKRPPASLIQVYTLNFFARSVVFKDEIFRTQSCCGFSTENYHWRMSKIHLHPDVGMLVEWVPLDLPLKSNQFQWTSHDRLCEYIRGPFRVR